MQLHEIQNHFKSCMLSDAKALDEAHDIFEKVFSYDSKVLSGRLKIYRNNIVGSLTNILCTRFEALQSLVGEDFFKTMAHRFIEQHPPEAGDLNNYGHSFALFIEQFEPTAHLPYLADVAQLEMALNDTYYERDDLPLTPESLAAITPDNLANIQLTLRHHIRLVKSNYPIDAIRRFALNAAECDAPNLDQGGVYLMIRRNQFDCDIQSLCASEWSLLTQFQSNKKLGDALEYVMELDGSFDFRAFLQRHIALETFQALTKNTNPIS